MADVGGVLAVFLKNFPSPYKDINLSNRENSVQIFLSLKGKLTIIIVPEQHSPTLGEHMLYGLLNRPADHVNEVTGLSSGSLYCCRWCVSFNFSIYP